MFLEELSWMPDCLLARFRGKKDLRNHVFLWKDKTVMSFDLPPRWFRIYLMENGYVNRISLTMLLSLFLVFLQLALASCGGGGFAGGRDIAFSTLDKGVFCYYALEITGGVNSPPIFKVVVDRQGWDELREFMYPPEYVKEIPPAPSFDPSKELAIAAFQGVKPTGGYSIEIVSLKKEDGKVTVGLNIIEPLPKDMVTQAFTSPYHIVSVSRDDLESRGETDFLFVDNTGHHLATITVDVK